GPAAARGRPGAGHSHRPGPPDRARRGRPRAAHPPYRRAQLRHRQRAPRLLSGALPEGRGMSARVQAIGSAMPDAFVFKQSEIVEAFFARQPGWDPEWAEVFANSGVERRASVVDPSLDARTRSTADGMREIVPAARR